ncbi:hypothetical protein C8R44DRAFT_746983 [Mycena epipterygia]|nr:hypothetical protein C8R44DRAFT_746983 [Mycena epipterygia]
MTTFTVHLPIIQDFHWLGTEYHDFALTRTDRTSSQLRPPRLVLVRRQRPCSGTSGPPGPTASAKRRPYPRHQFLARKANLFQEKSKRPGASPRDDGSSLENLLSVRPEPANGIPASIWDASSRPWPKMKLAPVMSTDPPLQLPTYAPREGGGSRTALSPDTAHLNSFKPIRRPLTSISLQKTMAINTRRTREEPVPRKEQGRGASPYVRQ